MKLSVNHSQTLLDLLSAGQVQVDAIEWVDKLSPEVIREARAALPQIAFHFHPGRMRFSSKGVAHLREYLGLCPQSLHVSIHLAPLPMAITYPAMRWGVYLPTMGAKSAVKRFVRQVRWLQNRCDQPVILENMPTLHPTRYHFESEPAVIRDVLDQTGCSLLLDLAHARIAAQARSLPVEDYLAALPLEKTAQIHLAGVRAKPDGRLYDAHQHLLEPDYQLLEWTLRRTRPAWITLEYFLEDPQALREQISKLRQFLN